jgi:hypothetical protein
MPRRRSFWLFALTAILVVSGCGFPATPAAKGKATSRPAPEISGADADGKSMTLSDYRGKVVMLDFWATW